MALQHLEHTLSHCALSHCTALGATILEDFPFNILATRACGRLHQEQYCTHYCTALYCFLTYVPSNVPRARTAPLPGSFCNAFNMLSLAINANIVNIANSQYCKLLTQTCVIPCIPEMPFGRYCPVLHLEMLPFQRSPFSRIAPGDIIHTLIRACGPVHPLTLYA